MFGGPYPGFTPPSQPGESDKKQLVQNHLRVFKEQVSYYRQLSADSKIKDYKVKSSFIIIEVDTSPFLVLVFKIVINLHLTYEKLHC